MLATNSRILLVATLTLALFACNRQQAQNPSPTEAESAAPAAPDQHDAVPPPAAVANQPAPIAPATELQVDRVTSVMVSRAPNAPDSIIIHAAGTVVSPGWSDAKLALIEDPNAVPTIKAFSFVATSPEMPDEKRAPAAVETELRVDALPAEVQTIRIVSATNAVSAPIVQ
jgi:hypothetical protein